MAEGLAAVKESLRKAGLAGIEVQERLGAVALGGAVSRWEQYIAAGYAAAGKGYRGVVNEIEVAGLQKARMPAAPRLDAALEGRYFDAVVIGGGIIGTSIARELTRYNITVALLEKEADVACHSTGRNNGMVHEGFAPKPGTLKARYNARGNVLYSRVAEELGVKLERPGTIVLFTRSWQTLLMPFIHRRARQNNVPGLRYLSPREVRALEPHVWEGQKGGFLMPTTAIISPYKMAVAYIENAAENGAEVFLQTAVTGFTVINSRIDKISTNRGELRAGVVINAAGLWADELARLAGDGFFTLHGRRGVMAILDKKTAPLQRTILGLFQSGSSRTKGGGLLPTVDGNLLIGPNAEEFPGREDYHTEPADLDYLLAHHLSLNRRLKREAIITYFAGVRPCTFDEDFIIEASPYVNNLIHVAGIQSPGLASAPAIAADVRDMAVRLLERERPVKPDPHFNPRRRVAPPLQALPLAERARLIRENPAYGRIVCRCEGVSEGEIVDSLRAPVPALTLDAIKRRVRPGMGRCQGGFCTPRVLEIMAREKNLPVNAISKSGPGSPLVLGCTGINDKPPQNGTE